MLLKLNAYSLICPSKRYLSLSSVLNKFKPPEEEVKRSPTGKRNKNLDPYNRLWTLTTKSAEPYNKKGGHVKWTQMKHLMRGVQMPGYYDKNGKFIFVDEMVPEIVMPDLTNCNLKPYVSYNVEDIETPKLTAQQLFNEVYRDSIITKFKEENQEITEKKQDS